MWLIYSRRTRTNFQRKFTYWFAFIRLEKGNIVPIHKKGDKQVLKNYRPILLLPIYGKVFERLIFNELLNFLLENNLISPNQSGFKPWDSCINQIFTIHLTRNWKSEASSWTFLHPLSF